MTLKQLMIKYFGKIEQVRVLCFSNSPYSMVLKDCTGVIITRFQEGERGGGEREGERESESKREKILCRRKRRPVYRRAFR